MSYYDPNARRTSQGMADTPSWVGAQIDAGLRVHMQRVYSYMAGGLALTGIVAYVAASSGFYQAIAGTPLIWLVMLAPLGFVLALSFGIQRMSAGTAAPLVLDLCGRDGTVAREHLSGVHRRLDRPRVLHHGRDLRRDERLRIYDP